MVWDEEMKIILQLLMLALLPKTLFLIPLLDRQWKKSHRLPVPQGFYRKKFNSHCWLRMLWMHSQGLAWVPHFLWSPEWFATVVFPLELRAAPTEAALSPVRFESSSSGLVWQWTWSANLSKSKPRARSSEEENVSGIICSVPWPERKELFTAACSPSVCSAAQACSQKVSAPPQGDHFTVFTTLPAK